MFPRSTHLESASYDPSSKTMNITFKDGRSYDYSGVPVDTYIGLTMAGSAGEFFNSHIRDRFSYEEV